MNRERLLEAAGEIFAEHGFRNTTVREICKRADINLAAVNYYFRDKQGIYEAVLLYAHRHAAGKYPAASETIEGIPPVERLKSFVCTFLRRILDEGRPSWHGRLIAREMIEPTGILDKLIDEEIRPKYELLFSIVEEILGADAGKKKAALCTESIMAQCLFYRHSHLVLKRLRPGQDFSAEEVDKLAAHIAQFSLAALGGAKEG